jgi:hypothetical protein
MALVFLKILMCLRWLIGTKEDGSVLSIFFGSIKVQQATEALRENQHPKGKSFGTGSIARTLSNSSQHDQKRSLQLQSKKEKEMM